MSGTYTVDGSYKAYLDGLGIPAELVFKKAGIPILPGQDMKLTVSRDQYIDFMNELGKYADDKIIIDHGNIEGLQMFVPPLFAAMCAENGLACFKRISKYKQLIGPFKLGVKESEDEVCLEFYFENEEQVLPRFTVLTEQVLMLHIIRQATGKRIVPKEIGSIYDYGQTLIDFIGRKPIRIQGNYIVFHREDLLEPYLTQNNVMWSYLEPELLKRMKEVKEENSTSAKVRQVLFEKVPAGEDNIEAVARTMALSVRSLQRSLAEEKTTFIKELSKTREILARNYLKEPSLNNDEVAFLIGYSDANAFSRAFRKWTGQTLGQYRKSLA